jgi:hypothetical protein
MLEVYFWRGTFSGIRLACQFRNQIIGRLAAAIANNSLARGKKRLVYFCW